MLGMQAIATGTDGGIIQPTGREERKRPEDQEWDDFHILKYPSLVRHPLAINSSTRHYMGPVEKVDIAPSSSHLRFARPEFRQSAWSRQSIKHRMIITRSDRQEQDQRSRRAGDRAGVGRRAIALGGDGGRGSVRARVMKRHGRSLASRLKAMRGPGPLAVRGNPAFFTSPLGNSLEAGAMHAPRVVEEPTTLGPSANRGHV
jgi:hypothetical protein